MTDEEIVAALLNVIAPWHSSIPAGNLTTLGDALLPVVRRIAEQRAAEELRDAAHAITDDGRPDLTTVDQVNAVDEAAQWLDDRADALDPS